MAMTYLSAIYPKSTNFSQKLTLPLMSSLELAPMKKWPSQDFVKPNPDFRPFCHSPTKESPVLVTYVFSESGPNSFSRLTWNQSDHIETLEKSQLKASLVCYLSDRQPEKVYQMVKQYTALVTFLKNHSILENTDQPNEPFNTELYDTSFCQKYFQKKCIGTVDYPAIPNIHAHKNGLTASRGTFVASKFMNLLIKFLLIWRCVKSLEIKVARNRAIIIIRFWFNCSDILCIWALQVATGPLVEKMALFNFSWAGKWQNNQLYHMTRIVPFS